MLRKVLFLLLFLFLLSPTDLHAQETWTIDSFHTDIHISATARVLVVETIVADFGSEQNHGIYRDIPVSYETQSGNKLNVLFDLIEVTDLAGNKLKFAEHREGKNAQIKIGHPNIFVTGKQTYLISYVLERVITTPNNQVEFYWNVTGLDWQVPIKKASATVVTEADFLDKSVCFVGVYGSTLQTCGIDFATQKTHFTSGILRPGEGMTIVLGIDPQTITLPSKEQEILWFIRDNWLYATPLLTLLLMIHLYWQRGRDRKYKNIFSESGSQTVPLLARVDGIMTFGPPKDLSPGEVGVLVDERVDTRDITAVIIDLARRGFFTIKDILPKKKFAKSKIELILAGKSENDLLDFEKAVLDMLFTKKRDPTANLKKLHKTAYMHMERAQKYLYAHMTQLKYFSGNPQTVRGIYLAIGIGLISLGVMIASSSVGKLLGSGGGYFASIASGIIVILFSFFMPARTPKGRKALKEIVGLREWIRIGAWREKIHEKNNFIEEVLPYTIAFGLTKKFIKALKESDLKNIEWYQSNQALNIGRFADTMQTFDKSVTKAVSATRPSSASGGGSGFSGGGSGGGFGGGGGGSW